jgi:predicted P-loop ATPase
MTEIFTLSSQIDDYSCHKINGKDWQDIRKLSIECPLCNKKDWCFVSPDRRAVQCGRSEAPDGWKFAKVGKDGRNIFYMPEHPTKSARLSGREDYIYTDNQGNDLIKVVVVRPGKNNRDKDVWQEYWNGMYWSSARSFPEDKKAEYQKRVTWFKYTELQQDISNNKPVFIVEGEGVVVALRALGVAATTTIAGAGKYRKYGTGYKEDLTGVDIVVLCPDRDTPGLKHMEDINIDFPDARWLYAPPSDFYWTHLPQSQGLDLKDWIMDGATVEDIMGAIQERQTVVDQLNKNLEGEATRQRPASSKHHQNFNMIQAAWGDRLRYNKLTKKIELDGKYLPMDGLRTTIAVELDIDVSRHDAKEIVIKLALKNQYSPVQEYLSSVVEMHPTVDVSILDTIASRYLGTDDPLHAAEMKRTLIAAVARAYQPGCKHDNICILQGEQGSLKSTFFEVLAGEEFFTDDLTGNEKDEALKLSRYWMLEHSEFESAYRTKEVSQLKAFLSRKTDAIRPPYAADVEEMPRPSIFVGSTNKSEFLKDPTGERRYWVIPVKVKKIDIKKLKAERDLIWAAAVTAYNAGEQWHLTREEEELLRIANGEFRVSDCWEDAIYDYVAGREYVTVNEILTNVLNFELKENKDTRVETRVADCLKKLGWKKAPTQRRINGKPRWIWEAPAIVITSPMTELITEAVTPSSPCTESNTASVIGVTSKSSTLLQKNIEENNQQQNIDTSKLQEKLVTDMTENKTIAVEESQGVIPSVITPVTGDANNEPGSGVLNTETPIQLEVQESIQVATSDFDAVGNAEIMVACLDVPNGGAFLLNLCQSWTDEQKAAVRRHMTVEQVNHARQLMKQTLLTKTKEQAPVINVLTRIQVEQPESKKIEPGARVRYVGDDAKLQEKYQDAELVVHSVVGNRQADCQVIRNGEIVEYTSWFFLGVNSDEKRELRLYDET